MSLRDNCKEKLDAYLPVGGVFSGLFSRIAERVSSAEAIIRKPGHLKSHNRTFRDDPYFKHRIEAEETISSIRPVNWVDSDELFVVGVAKLPLELEAVKNVGVEYVRTDLAEIEEQEEIIAENYDIKYKRNKY